MYYITPKVARIFVNHFRPILMHVDQYMGSIIASNPELRGYYIPRGCDLNGMMNSTIHHNLSIMTSLYIVIGSLTVIILVLIGIMVRHYVVSHKWTHVRTNVWNVNNEDFMHWITVLLYLKKKYLSTINRNKFNYNEILSWTTNYNYCIIACFCDRIDNLDCF